MNGVIKNDFILLNFLMKVRIFDMSKPISKSFYDWCIETNNTYLLELWDYRLNDLNPEDVGFGTSKWCYFKCPRGIHASELYKINNITGEKHQQVNCRRCHSFGQWCLDNNQSELLDRWDYGLNNKDPFEVNVCSGQKYYFKCPLLNPLHPSEAKILSNVVQQEGSRRCIGCESFAQWCIDNVDSDFMEKYWSDKNTENPFTFTTTHSKKVWIKCQDKDYHGDYEIAPYNFKAGKRCPYCAGKKVHYFDSLGYLIPSSILMWSNKNDKTPFDYLPHSNKKVWFCCTIHGEYLQEIHYFTKNEGNCPKCMLEDSCSKLQYKVNKYIRNTLKYKCLHERDCTILPINPKTNCGLPFDNEVLELKLIIEVNGKQHYETCQYTFLTAKNKGTTQEEELIYQQWKDQFKKEYALSQGYYYLEIPYWTDDKTKSYQKLIDDKIQEILNEHPEYNKYRTLTTAGDTEQLVS